jgi:ubiquinone/menaquinone biosynthesis C-methylase UbiE
MAFFQKRMTEFMARDFKNVLAVDVSGEMIKLAKKRLETANNISLFETDGETFPFATNSIDFIFSFLVFQHVPDKKIIEKNFTDIYRVLKEDGIFKVRIRGVKTIQKQWYSGADYNLESATQLCKQTGFELIHYDGVGTSRFWLWLSK